MPAYVWLEGITRNTGTRPHRQAAAATPDLLRKMLATRPASNTPLGAHDRALLLVGLALDDVVAVAGKGLQVAIRRSKTDPHGAGQLSDKAVWRLVRSAAPGRWVEGLKALLRAFSAGR